jgi:branched-chain amino acid transport system ATP-binding protein
VKALLRAQGLGKHFAGVQALRAVDLDIAEGQVHSVIGPNGAGKSTLINVLTGRIQPDTGTVSFDGAPLKGLQPYAISQLGIARVFQSPEVYPELTVLENVAIGALAARDGSFRLNLLRHPRRQADVFDAASATLASVGLAAHAQTPAQHLSRGDKRRLELAICLACKPRLLLLDEPTAGMSPSETHSTVALLKQISSAGLTMLVVEHDMKVVFTLSHRITVLHQGRVIAQDTPEAIRRDPGVREAYLGGATL